MHPNKVYLCGPITGLTYGEAALSWRHYVHNQLKQVGIDCYSPMRGKLFLKDVGKIGAQSYDENVLSATAGVIGRDKFDTMNATVVFANFLGAKIPSIGSCVEFGWASAMNVPIVLVMEKDGSNPHEHMFIKGLPTYHWETVDEAIASVKLLMLPGI